MVEENEVAVERPVLKEYRRPLEMEREANSFVRASFDLSEVDLGNGEKMALSIVRVDDFPAGTPSDGEVTTSAYLIRRVYGRSQDDLTEFRNVGERLDLDGKDKEKIVDAISRQNLPLTMAVTVSLDEFEKNESSSWQGKCKETPLMIGLTGEPGQGKTALLAYFVRNNIPAASYDDVSFYNLFRYVVNTNFASSDASSVREDILSLREKREKKKGNMPHFASKSSVLARLIDEGRMSKDYIFIDTPPNWRQRAVKGIAPDPHVFDMFVSSLEVVIDIAEFSKNEKGITPEEMERVKSLVESDEFTNWKNDIRQREDSVRNHVVSVLRN